jgi:hypothetical protein
MDSGMDRQLRQSLEPRPESVERIVRGALAEGQPSRRPRRSRLLPAVAGASALLALALLFLFAPRPRASASIENVGEVLIVRHPEGRVLIRNGEAAESSLPSGSMIVVHGGTR